MKTSFVVSTGKKKRKVDDASSAVPTPSSTAHAKRRRSSIGLTAMATVTPGSASTMPAGSSLTNAAGSSFATRNASLAMFHAGSSHPSASGSIAEYAMLIDRDFVPPHSQSRTSGIQPVYRRLLPSDIVRLMAGDDIIVVVPVHGEVPRKGDDADASRFHYRKLFENIIRRSFRDQNNYRSDLDSIICARHTLIRGGRPVPGVPLSYQALRRTRAL